MKIISFFIVVFFMFFTLLGCDGESEIISIEKVYTNNESPNIASPTTSTNSNGDNTTTTSSTIDTSITICTCQVISYISNANTLY